MIALGGYLGVIVSLAAAALLTIRGVRIARNPGLGAERLRTPAFAILGGAVVAFAALQWGLLTHDFTIEYVASHSSRATPLVFLLAGGWAALEGSILLWGLVLAVFIVLALRGVGGGDGLGAGAMAVMGGVAVFWFGMMATVADPFRVCTEVANGVCAASSLVPFASTVAPADGLGPNPLLQNHFLMAVHPPVLYLGYVGFTVPFAFALSALARGEQGRAWLDRTHRWTLVAWSFLTLGIVLGMWWSYEVLGWGGYWAWDPVENAALLPWLVATAFVHSAVVQRRRGMLQVWNIVLVIAAFALTILGTFLTRSGVIASVHSFTQSAVGPTLLGFLGVVVIASLGLFAFRAHLVASSPRLESLASREGMVLVNNLLLTLFAFTLLVGTMYPMFVEAFDGRQVSVGRPFFDRITIPIAFALLLAMGVGPITPYRVARPATVWRRVRIPIDVALVMGAAAVVVGVRSVPVVIVVVLGSFVIAVILRHFWTQVRSRRERGERIAAAAAGILRREPGFWGGQLSHVGVAIAAIAIAASSALAVRQEVRLDVGASAQVDAYCVVYDGPFTRNDPQRRVEGAVVRILDASCGDEVAVLEPRLNHYPNAVQAVATPAVHTGLLRDVYVSLAGGSVDSIVLDVYVVPLMWMLWMGGLIAVAGGVWALAGRKPDAGHRSSKVEIPSLMEDTRA